MPAPNRRTGRVTPKGTRPPGTTTPDQHGERPARDRTAVPRRSPGDRPPLGRRRPPSGPVTAAIADHRRCLRPRTGAHLPGAPVRWAAVGRRCVASRRWQMCSPIGWPSSPAVPAASVGRRCCASSPKAPGSSSATSTPTTASASSRRSATPTACCFVRTDVAEEAEVEALIGAAVERFGGLDVLFNNAGVGGAFGPLTELDRRRLGPHVRRARAQRVPRHQARRAGDDRPGARRQHHQHRVGRRPERRLRPAGLLGGQGGGRQPHVQRRRRALRRTASASTPSAPG